jgi:hypothetical protein
VKKNNVNLAAVGALVERARTEPGAVRLQKRVEGSWSFKDGTPQFGAIVPHGTGASVLQADMAPAFGGGGLAAGRLGEGRPGRLPVRLHRGERRPAGDRRHPRVSGAGAGR